MNAPRLEQRMRTAKWVLNQEVNSVWKTHLFVTCLDARYVGRVGIIKQQLLAQSVYLNRTLTSVYLWAFFLRGGSANHCNPFVAQVM